MITYSNGLIVFIRTVSLVCAWWFMTGPRKETGALTKILNVKKHEVQNQRCQFLSTARIHVFFAKLWIPETQPLIEFYTLGGIAHILYLGRPYTLSWSHSTRWALSQIHVQDKQNYLTVLVQTLHNGTRGVPRIFWGGGGEICQTS